MVRRAYSYKRSLDRGTGDDDDPDYHGAHYIFAVDQLLKNQIDILLVSGADNQTICQHLADESLESTVQAYHDIFFAVRPWLGRPIQMIRCVFEGETYCVNRSDNRGFALRMAWVMGTQIAESLLTSRISDAQLSDIRETIRNVLTLQLSRVAYSASYSYEMPGALDRLSELGGILFDEGKDGESSDGEHAGAVRKFFEGMGITVADSTDRRNLDLPAEETQPVLEYEVS